MLKKILNRSEEKTNLRLASLCASWGSRIFSKVRIADVLQIDNSGISNSDYTFALRAHFDFVVADAQTQPLFAVEFDGPLHATDGQRRRDEVKNRLAARFGLPLLRVTDEYLDRQFRSIDLLSWFVECWFFAEAFQQAQNDGAIPQWEPCDPMSVCSLPGYDKDFPLWLSAEARDAMHKLERQGRLVSNIPNVGVYIDAGEDLHAIAFIEVAAGEFALAQKRVRAQNFAFGSSELAQEIVVVELFERVKSGLATQSGLVPRSDVQSRVNHLKSKFAFSNGSWTGEKPF
jgi:hypothetical protein